MSHSERAIGVVLGVVLGIAVIILFVFIGSDDTIDAPAIDSNPAIERETDATTTTDRSPEPIGD